MLGIPHGFERAIVTATELADLLDVKPVFKETRKESRIDYSITKARTKLCF
jgi:hypothetical protein